MILLTGATGTLGKPLLSRLVGTGADLRCLVRDPRRLGPARVQVQITIGNLAGRDNLARAVRGADTVIHLAATTRDQGRGSIEQINGVGTARLVNAAQRAGVKRFVYVSSIGASRNAASRFIRSQALARDAVIAGDFESLIFEASIVYDNDDRWISLLRRMSHLPVMLVPGDGRARFQPIWAHDAADAIAAAMLNERDGLGGGVGRSDSTSNSHSIELAGPELLTHDQLLREAMNTWGRRRPLLHVPRGVARRALRLQEWYLGPSTLATWDEAALMDYESVPSRGTADVEALGVSPLTMAEVLER